MGWGDGGGHARHGGNRGGPSLAGSTIRVKDVSSAPTPSEWVSSMPGSVAPSRPESAASRPASSATHNGQQWWPEYRPLTHTDWASDSTPDSRAPSRSASAVHSHAPFGDVYDPRFASAMHFPHPGPASAAPPIETIEWGQMEGFGMLSIYEPSLPTPSVQQPHQQAHPLGPAPQSPRSLVAQPVPSSPANDTHETFGPHNQAAPSVRKPISLQISSSQAPLTPPSAQASRGLPFTPRGSSAHTPSPRGAHNFRGSPSPRGRGRGAYGGDVFHPLPDHRYRRNYGYAPNNSSGYHVARGRGRGRGRGGKLWTSRDTLTPEALSSVKDESFAATGSLGSWAKQTRPLSPPQEELEQKCQRPGTPPSMPPTPWASPRYAPPACPSTGPRG